MNKLPEIDDLVVYQNGIPQASESAIDLQEFKRGVNFSYLVVHRYQSATFLAVDLDNQSRLFQLGVLLKVISRGPVIMRDKEREVTVTWSWITRRFVGFVITHLRFAILRVHHWLKLKRLTNRHRRVRLKSQTRRVLYLRCDTWNGADLFGGSIAHISGVINSLLQQGWAVDLVSRGLLPLVDRRAGYLEVSYAVGCNDIVESAPFFLSKNISQAVKALSTEPPTFIYQRHALHAFCGVELKHHLRVPLVVEFNGSELWISENWGTPIRFPRLAESAEKTVLMNADLVVCVSEADRCLLKKMGVEKQRILLNPNGFDEKRFNPGVDGISVRRALAIDERFVFLFSGSFGVWHGVPFLVETFLGFAARHPEAVLVCVGDGITAPEARRVSENHPRIVFTGSVNPEDMPGYLAAADVLVAPHLPNPDGTEFFGSPIKIFEYLGMGKPIIAAELGQIGEILTHRKTALLYEPGNAEALAEACRQALDDQALRLSIASGAKTLSQSYSWSAHTHKIVKSLDERSRGA